MFCILHHKLTIYQLNSITMKKVAKKASIVAGLLIAIFMMSATTASAQTFNYKTSNGQMYLQFKANGDSWTVSTAVSGGNWVGSTMLYSDNTNGYYKCKSHRTQNVYEVWIKGDNVTMKVLGSDGQYYNYYYTRYYN